MAPRTLLWQLLPWLGGINTSSEPALIPENQCQNIENAFSGLNDAKSKRRGINKNWDGRSTNASTHAVIGGSDFNFYSNATMEQKRISIDDSGSIRVFDPDDGTSSALTVSGVSLVSPTIATIQVINSLLIASMDGTSNRIKKVQGDNTCTDLLSRWDHTTISRSSSGTTRTVVLGQPFKGSVNDYAVLSGMGQSTYNGTFVVTAISTTTLTNDTIAYTVGSSLSEGSTGDTAGTVQGLAPNGSILGKHQGRLLTNDKTKNYRVHYSPPDNPELWGGYGDSGAMDFDPGDNDPIGVTAVFPTFQGDLYVAKSQKLYRVRGVVPDHVIEVVTEGLGCIGQEAVAAIDQRDIIWASEKGLHSLQTTQKFGDVEEAFLSKDIQYSFNGNGVFGWDVSRRKYTKLRYLTTENTLFVATTESRLSETKNNCLWLLNTQTGQWDSRWPDVSCESIFVGNDAERKRIYCGSSTGRLYQTFSSNRFDTSEANVRSTFVWRLKTAKISVDKNPNIKKSYKSLRILYTPIGTQVITATVKVDGIRATPYSFPDSGTGTPLGDTFILGTSLLGSGGVYGPRSRSLVGSGRTIEITLSESGATAEFAISGIAIEYQPEGVVYRTEQGSN